MRTHKATMRKNDRMMFDIEVKFAVGLEEISYAIYNQMNVFGKELPLLRKECLDYVKIDLGYGNSLRDGWSDDLDEELYNRIKKRVTELFPEL